MTHRMRVTFEWEGHASFKVECGYDLTDRNRPCWARDFDGDFDKDGADYCNYAAWVENVGAEIIEGNNVSVVLPFEVKWAGDDTPSFHLLAEGDTP